ncbi:hypothetical protein [Actinoplanes regularis]|uniref:Uncharacterized protein n=1 Tax=Actinoplanes regularis TaxID=52697 RepID=A0A239BEH5_9ACTN|nr:hypothetical protein [Actinoplanes regularis]GIE87948.1 hypothetical protein Are01nite_44280 [Actinoplanes regularis]SNS06206.1 hypothetical protein SAMN06264365_109152 [Actinoplanes regularis]
MKLVSVGSQGRDLPPDVLAASGNTPFSRFNITVGNEYRAHAMELSTYGLNVLVVVDTGWSYWVPISLFRVVDGALPAHWEFAVVENGGPVLALWGYPSLIHDPDHHDDLIEREPAAVEVFRREAGIGDSGPKG